MKPAAPHAKTLPERNADFTAEGAPPPGVVGTAVPAPKSDETGSKVPDDPKHTHDR